MSNSQYEGNIRLNLISNYFWFRIQKEKGALLHFWHSFSFNICPRDLGLFEF